MIPMNTHRIRTVAIGLLTALCILFTGCIEDDLSECGVGVKYRYIKNVEGVDKFPSDIDKVALYVFREDGLFHGKYEDGGDHLDSNYTMNLNLKAGNYTLVAWGNLSDDYDVTGCIPGQTRIEEFLLRLKNVNDTVHAHPGHLYWGMGTVEIKKPYTGRTYTTVDFWKDTNTIRVVTSGLPLGDNTPEGAESGTPYTCRIISRNGEYLHDNTIAGNRLTYIPSYSVEGSSFISDFVTMRELNDASITGSELVIMYHPTDGGAPKELLRTALTGLLVKASVTGDLDIDDYFLLEVEFDYTHGSATVTINDFVVVDGGGGIIG